MLIIAGHVTVDPARRDEYVAAFADLIRRARAAPGCLDAAITADPVEPGRVYNLERWASVDDLKAFRAVANAPQLDVEYLDTDVRLWDASGERDPFDV